MRIFESRIKKFHQKKKEDADEDDDDDDDIKDKNNTKVKMKKIFKGDGKTASRVFQLVEDKNCKKSFTFCLQKSLLTETTGGIESCKDKWGES